jgi:hypothetical protein
MILAVPTTGDTAIVTIPPGTTQPEILATTTNKITTVPGAPNAVSVYKVGTDLVFEFNIGVPSFNAMRLM